MTKLLELAADPVLLEDVPGKGVADALRRAPLRSRTEPLRVRFAEYGLYALEDVRALPDGGHLLALGEGGVVLAREGGRVPLRFPVPATDLVVSHNGRRALALARREKAVRVSRIDLVSGKVEDWFSAELQFWAREYDAATWSVVVADRRLMVLDATAEGRSVLWQVSDMSNAIGFEAQGEHEALLLRQGPTVEHWRYALPARRLLARQRVFVPENTFAALPDCRDDQPVLLEAVSPGRADDEARHFIFSQCGGATKIDWPHGQLPQASVHDGLALLQFDGDDGWHCKVMNNQHKIVADIVLPDALEPRASLHAGHLLAWDRHGRLVDVDIDTGAVRTLTFG